MREVTLWITCITGIGVNRQNTLLLHWRQKSLSQMHSTVSQRLSQQDRASVTHSNDSSMTHPVFPSFPVKSPGPNPIPLTGITSQNNYLHDTLVSGRMEAKTVTLSMHWSFLLDLPPNIIYYIPNKNMNHHTSKLSQVGKTQSSDYPSFSPKDLSHCFCHIYLAPAWPSWLLLFLYT